MKNNITLMALNSANTIEDLTNLGMGRPQYDIGHRGGYVAFYSKAVCDACGIPYDQLPNKVGVYCNYLGGGMRGALLSSEYSRVANDRKARKVGALIEACRRAYMNAEQDTLEDEDEWDRIATEAARKAGIGSAY